MENEDTILNAWSFDIVDKTTDVIKVIGVGGGGSNAVRNMYKRGVHNVSFAICNTDSQHLAQSDVPVKVQLGKNGLGAGGNPGKAKEAAMESLDSVERLFEDNTQMVFVAAGMGGGTGTGAGPIIARLAKEKGILTVGVVTIPFAFEGKKQIRKALKGVEEMRANVDALLVVNNERLCEINEGKMDVMEGFAKSDEVLVTATKNIAEIITIEGMINRDFCDVETVMKNGGDAIMSVGYASGEYRVEKAFLDALSSPLLNNVDIGKAQRLLYIVYSCDKNPVMMYELGEIQNFMDDLFEDVQVLWGLYPDKTLEEQVKVILIATDFIEEESTSDRLHETKQEDNSNNSMDSLMQKYYNDTHRVRKKTTPVVSTIEVVTASEDNLVEESTTMVEPMLESERISMDESSKIDIEQPKTEAKGIEDVNNETNNSSKLIARFKQLLETYIADE